MKRRVIQYISLFGLLIRKTAWKVALASIICCGLLYVMSGNACLFLEGAVVTLCLLLTFKRNNSGGLSTLRRLPFERKELNLAFTIVSGLNYVFGTMVLKLGVLEKIYFEMKKRMPDESALSIISKPAFYLSEEKYGLLYDIMPFPNVLILIIYLLIVLTFSILISRSVNYEAKY